MLAVLYGIYNFLVALVPLLEAFGTAALGIVAALYEIVKITAAVTAIVALVDILFDPRGAQRVGNLLANIVSGASKVSKPLVTALAPELQGVVATFVAAFQSVGPDLSTAVAGPLGALAAQNFSEATTNLTAAGPSTPDNAIAQAGAAFRQAFGFGMGASATAAAFESVFPEKLNVLNGVAPALGGMAGFEEVSGAVLEPLYENAFGKSLQYYYRGLFKPELPDETDAVLWHARQLISDDQLRTIFNYSGLKSEYEDAFVKSAFHGISPFVMIRLLEFPVFTDAQTRDELTFSGLRPQSQENMIAAGKYLAADPFRKQTQAAYETMYEEGLLSDVQLSTNIDSTRHTNDIDQLMVLRAQVLKVVKFTKEYVTSYVDLAIAGLIDIPTFQADMASLGYQPDAINARSAVIEARMAATNRRVELAAERRLEAQTTAALRRTALENFRSGAIDAAGYTAALLATGMTAVQAAAFADLAALQKQGNTRFLYGLQVQPEAAQLLRERVAALTDQRKKLLIDDAQFLAQLANLGIPGEVQNALLAAAAAQTTPKSQMTLVNVQT